MIDLSILRQIFVNFENSLQSKINFCQYVKTLVLEVYGRAGHDGHEFWLRHCLPLSGADRGFLVTMAFFKIGSTSFLFVGHAHYMGKCCNHVFS